MVTRTKSFFDHDHQRKPRPGQWTRRPYTSANNSHPPCAASNPTIPPTDKAKSKPQEFHFAARGPQDTGRGGEDGKENSDRSSDYAARRTSSAADGTANTPTLLHANTFPCTPGARLPLEDLIEDCDRPKQEDPVQVSPEEHIGWIPNSSSELLTPNQRKRKRAKSSSPAAHSSSQRGEHSTFFVDDKPPSSTTRTPAVDPVADLWQRYANAKQGGEGLKLPDISHLIFQGSPRPLETPVRSAGFRRWASTGNVDVGSRNKRRCTGGRGSINVYQDSTARDSTGKSKVATMVQQMQRIQETLASQQLEEQQAGKKSAKDTLNIVPASSSPLPETELGRQATPTTVSPLQSRQTNIKMAQMVAPTETKSVTQSFNFRPTQSGGVRTVSSYQTAGDPLNPSAAGPLHLQSKAPLPAYKRPSITRPLSEPKVPQVVPSPARLELDEFGADAFDLTADDLDELLSQKPKGQEALCDITAYPDPPLLGGDPHGIQVEAVCVDDDDEFGCDIDEDFLVQAEFSATQAPRSSPGKRSPRQGANDQISLSSTVNSYPTGHQRLQRYTVKQVVDGEYTNDKGRRCEERVLLAEGQQNSATVAITLRGSWVNTSVFPTDIVHVAYVPRFHEQAELARVRPGQVAISDDEWSPFLIVHPDHMLSATTVADSFDCIRKAVLQNRIKATGETSKAMVYGKILHEVFQQALSANQWDDDFLEELVERTIQAHVEGLWELGMRDTNMAAEEIKSKMGELASWASAFIAETPSNTSLVDDKQGEKVWMSISKLIAIEEHVWSPQFGLKGNIDATVQTTIVDDMKEPPKRLIVPFEVKTGRTTQSPAHRAQTALYTLLLSDRYNVAVDAGILYYLESSSMSRIAPPLMEVRQMIQQRNRLSAYIFKARHPLHLARADHGSVTDLRPPESQETEDSGLPKLLKNPYKCSRCYAQASCFTYHALVENGTAESAGMGDDQKKNHSLVWKEAVGHLLTSTKHGDEAAVLKRWFTKWDRLLTFEENDQSRLKSELWTMSSEQRQSLGRCFGNLVLVRDLTNAATIFTTQVLDGIEGSGGKINRFTYVFKRDCQIASGSFTEGSQLTIGEPIVVSSEQGQWALANGYVVAVSKLEITVAVDRRLGHSRERLEGFNNKTNQVFRGVMTVGERDRRPSVPHVAPMLYRLDKDEFSNGLALVRNNLVTLMSTHPTHTKLRETIILGAQPAFSPDLGSAAKSLQRTQLGEMNDDQQSAVDKVLSARDYALILGMPGTGKTTTIAHIIRALLADNKTILLTSFTHTAVDNILLKIRSIAPAGSILRLGVPAKINSQVQDFCQLAATTHKTINEIEQAYMNTMIVATTCMGTNHSLFQRRTFDVCIVDEASQITLPTILGPLLKARKFVLVGDHFQLPPLVQNKAALEGGLDMSLFRQLSEEQPESVAALGRQYRMCEDIMMLSNELIYSGKLKCGNEAVATRTLQVHDDAAVALDRFHQLPAIAPHGCVDAEKCWLSGTANPDNKVVFANTDACGKAALETLTGGKNITNQLEATLSAQLVLAFLAMGVPAAEIGVITLYRSQLALMRQLHKRAGIPKDVEIDSADRFQGRDKECIILSMVRSNDAGIVGDLLKDWRRVNVALTRARSKLVVLGSRRTLKNNDLLHKFIDLVDDRRWSIELPLCADEQHAFDFSTQVTQSLLAAVESPSGKRKSPTKRSPSQKSPFRRTQLRLSQSSTGKSPKQRSPLKSSSGNGNNKGGPKRIIGKGSRIAEKLRLAREQVAVEIFEDLTGEEF